MIYPWVAKVRPCLKLENIIQSTFGPKKEEKMKSENYFIVAAFASFVFSVTLWFAGDVFPDMTTDQELNRQQAIFVGIWVPSILSLGNLLKS